MYEEAPAADPRALLSAAALGSLAGVLLGAGYLLAGRIGTAPSLSPPAPVVGALATPIAAAPHPVLAGSVATPPSSRTPQLRWLHFAAPPFRPAAAETARDRQCLTQVVYYEARGEAAAGQQAVAQVVLNRLRHPAFPKSVCGVVFQRSRDGCQFSFACESHPAIGGDGAAWLRAQTVADQALDGFVMRQVGAATHFHVSNFGANWSQGLARVAQIGAHVFYGLTGRLDRSAPSLHAAGPAAAPEPPVLALAAPADLQRVRPSPTSEPATVAAAITATAGPLASPPRAETLAVAAVPAKVDDVVTPPALILAETQ